MIRLSIFACVFFFFQAEDGIRDVAVTGVQTCALPISVFAGWWSLNGNGEMTGTTWVEESGFLDGPVMITNTHSVGVVRDAVIQWRVAHRDRKSTRLNSSHGYISYAVFCLKKKNIIHGI